MRQPQLIAALQNKSKNVRLATMFGIVECLHELDKKDTSAFYELNEITPVDLETLKRMMDNKLSNDRLVHKPVFKDGTELVVKGLDALQPYFRLATSDEYNSYSVVGYNGALEIFGKREEG